MQSQETYSGMEVQGAKPLAGGAGVSPENLPFLYIKNTRIRSLPFIFEQRERRHRYDWQKTLYPGH